MGEYDGAVAAIILVIAIIAILFVAWCFWMVAGFICATFGWYAFSPDWAQWTVFFVMIIFAGVGGGRS